MKVDQPPSGGGGRQAGAKPFALHRVKRPAIRIVRIAVQAKDFNRPIAVVVIALVPRQREIGEVRIVTGRCGARETTVVIADGRKEAIGNGSSAVCTKVRINIIVEKLPYVFVDG